MNLTQRHQALACSLDSQQHTLSTFLCCCPLSAEVDLEILVNVDSLSEMDMWAKYVRSSKGRVVPLLSDNVHEARAYNRLANLAKAPLIMVWQDDQVGGGEAGCVCWVCLLECCRYSYWVRRVHSWVSRDPPYEAGTMQHVWAEQAAQPSSA